jgi:hypothetical protein
MFRLTLILAFLFMISHFCSAQEGANPLLAKKKTSVFNKALFDKVDSDGSGFLEFSEIKDFSYKNTAGDVNGFSKVDTNQNRKIEILEFLNNGKLLFREVKKSH